MLLSLISLVVAVAFATPTQIEERARIEKRNVTGNANVYLNNNTGIPEHLASGFIYGEPDTANQIPSHFYSDIDFGYGRAGGAQIPSPGLGWIWGLVEYENRFTSALSNYKTTSQNGGKFVFLLHDLWGADGSENSTAPFPGDNDDWSSWDDYLTRWISDMKSNDATTGLVIDIWNEPDGSGFWKRNASQWLEMWGRTYYRLRTDFNEVEISGPTLANPPSLTDTWWTGFMSFIKANGSIPDQYAWHMENGGDDMESAVATWKTLLTNAGLAQNGVVNINEYATYSEQVPCGGAWWIAQLERVNAIGLRGNWLASYALHDFMAGLLGKPNAGTSAYNASATGYWPAAEFQVYKYYAQNMTGYRVQTTPTPDLNGDIYATVGADKVRLLVGARITTGTWGVLLEDITAIGLPAAGTLEIQTWAFAGSSTHFAEVDAPTNLGIVGHTYTGGTLQFPVYQTDGYTAYAFEFAV